MAWLARNKKLMPGDIAEFKYYPNHPCEIQTIRIRFHQSSFEAVIDDQTHRSEYKYLQWLKQSQSWSSEPALVLVLHQRLLDTTSAKAVAVPYRESTLTYAFDCLYQHRAIAEVIRRHSPSSFSCKTVAAWMSKPEWGPAVVYICKSDTMFLTGQDDSVLSVTHFPSKSLIFAVAYDCTASSQEYLVRWVKFNTSFAFVPLLLPVLWAQVERKRLIDKIDEKTSHLRSGIIHMHNRLNAQDGWIQKSLRSRHSSSTTRDATSPGHIEMTGLESPNEITKRECAAVNLWVQVSTLKNGLEAFGTELKSMLKTLQDPLERNKLVFGPRNKDINDEKTQIAQHAYERIQSRLFEMIAEVQSRSRYIDSLLGGMTLATQTESNHLSRRDALTNIYIAVESRRDSSDMRYIAFLGMIFLPGTFFAAIFSTTFFNWIPQDSNQVVSPYVGIYFGFTAVSTVGTVWSFRKWAKKRDTDAALKVSTEIENYSRAGLLMPVDKPRGGVPVALQDV
ncbi:hypothetical protein F5Y16DRAFT_366872 [Xylariaceae sp. FL0255]|nr:hypothetical protein F5Y16DRAFT_366872 [Xylariaceae sp. FL0255]